MQGTFSPMGILEEWRQAEVIRYTVSCKNIGYTTGMYLAMNLKMWNSLPRDI